MKNLLSRIASLSLVAALVVGTSSMAFAGTLQNKANNADISIGKMTDEYGIGGGRLTDQAGVSLDKMTDEYGIGGGK